MRGARENRYLLLEQKLRLGVAKNAQDRRLAGKEGGTKQEARC